MIGITSSLYKGKLPNMVSESRFHVSQEYVDALAAQGAISCILPPAAIERVPEIVSQLSGLVLSGGADLAPHFSVKAKYLSITSHYAGESDIHRDLFEIALCREAIRQGKPVLGICRGLQVLNIALGGTLNQEINSEKQNHLQKEDPAVGTHPIKIFEGSLLHDVLNTTSVKVNSFHHQSIDLLGDHLEIMAVAEDGIIESIQYQGASFAIGVQWHPEAMVTTNEKMNQLFEYFVEEVRFAQKTFRKVK